MINARLPKSLRKFLRREKARIRREFSDVEARREKIKELYEKFPPKADQPLAEKIKRNNKKKVGAG